MALRGPVAAVVALAAFAAGLLAGRGCARTDADAPESASVAAAPRHDTNSRDDPAPRGRRARRSDPPPATTPAEQETTAPPATTPDAAAPVNVDFPFADVVVAWPDGSPAGNAIVYALPAGASSGEDDEPPSTNTDHAGWARIHAVARGRYDVGGLLGSFQAMATDVEFPRAEPLRLVLPEPATVVVHLPDRGGPEKGHEQEGQFRVFLRMDAEEPRAFPGRSQTSRGWTEIWIRGKGEDWTGIVPRGTRCRIDRTNLFRAEPETFVAPAEVRVTPAPKYQIHLRAEVRPNGRRIDGPTRLTLRFHHAAPGLRGRARHVCDVSVLMGGGDRATICEQDMLLDDASGALQWSGAGVLAGAVELRDLPDATTGATRTPIDARIDLDPRPSGDVPETREQETEYSFRASGAGDTDDDIECHLLGADGDVDTTTIPRGEVLTMTRLGLRCAFASCGPLVSETVALTATPAGPHLFELAPGGFLVVVPANLPPRTLGAAFLERDDGRPFLWDGGRDVGTRRTLEAGAVLGPLLPGPVTFRVTLQGRVLATATATVRAGTYETLKLPRLRAQ